MSSGDDNHAKHVTVTVDAGAWVSVTGSGEGSPLFSVVCGVLLMPHGATVDK